MRTKNIIIILAALALGWLAVSCAKQNDIDSYKETTDGRFGTVEEQMEYLNGLLVIIGEEQVELEAYLEKLEKSSNALAPIVDSLIDDLDGRVQEVLDTLDNFARKDSMKATFATLDAVKKLSGTTAALEVKVKADSVTLTESLKDKIAATQKAVTEKFKSYYTKDSLETLLKVQSDRMDTLSANADSAGKEIVKLRNSINELRKQQQDISKKLDEEIVKLKGTDTNIGESIANLDKKISTELESLKSDVAGYAADITALEARVRKLELRVQSIEVVPDYADGSVDMKMMETSIRFEVRPRYLIDSLAGKPGLFSFQIIKTEAATKAGIFADTITVLSVNKSAEDSLLTVTVDGKEMPDDFFAETQTYSARLVLSDGNTDRTSAYFPLTPPPANCYIVSAAGTYKFAAVKGNSDESVGDVKGVKVLWESFGTSTTPNAGDIISAVSYSNGKITYTATDKKGNAVIAAYSDASCTAGNVLWSWHIWLTDQPAEQVYNNSAGTMLDRNLGATSAEKGKVEALGLLYQWGRKDPFLNADAKYYESSPQQAASTLAAWPVAAVSDCLGGGTNTLSYSIKNPTTFIKSLNANVADWYCANTTYRNDCLWITTDNKKTIYDPCPAGYRVPDGGTSGVWRVAFGKDEPSNTWDDTNKGYDFGEGTDKLVSSGTCWYPAAGYRSFTGGALGGVGSYGHYWSCTPDSNNAYGFYFSNSSVDPSIGSFRALCRSVRCVKE